MSDRLNMAVTVRGAERAIVQLVPEVASQPLHREKVEPVSGVAVSL